MKSSPLLHITGNTWQCYYTRSHRGDGILARTSLVTGTSYKCSLHLHRLHSLTIETRVSVHGGCFVMQRWAVKFSLAACYMSLLCTGNVRGDIERSYKRLSLITFHLCSSSLGGGHALCLLLCFVHPRSAGSVSSWRPLVPSQPQRPGLQSYTGCRLFFLVAVVSVSLVTGMVWGHLWEIATGQLDRHPVIRYVHGMPFPGLGVLA